MISTKKWLVILSGVPLLATFFLPWVKWDGTEVAGFTIATGDFFKLSAAKLYLDNPFPALAFLFYAFFLIPTGALGLIFMTLRDRNVTFISIAVAILSLSLLTLFLLFTDFGTGSWMKAIQPWAIVHGLAAIVPVLVLQRPALLKRIGLLVAGPILVYASFKLTEEYLMGETHKGTAKIKADYSFDAPVLIKEFLANDTASNRKYLDKVLEVKGAAAAIDIAADSSSTIRFADSTGSYLIFSMEKEAYANVKPLKTGDTIVVKGVCSGSIFSEILGTTSISFKRAVLDQPVSAN